MRVVLLGENSSVHIQKWIKAIASQPGVELHVLSFDHGVKFEGVSYYPLKKITGTKLDYLLNLYRVKSYIRQLKPDLVHAHYATSYGFLGAFSGFHPFVITGWGADIFDSPNNPVMKRLLQYSFRKADGISVLSKITQEEMKKLTDKPVRLIPFGVDIAKFAPQQKPMDGKIRIGTIRTLAEKYGVEYLIRAFAQLCVTHQNLQLEIVGDGPLREALENLTRELNIADKVVFHGYVNQNSDFEKYIVLLGSFDIFAILSILDSETFGVAAVEASACGIPVIASNVGGLPEVITNEETGIIVPPKNAEATANALERLISDEGLRLQLGKNGRSKVERLYDWHNNTLQMIQLYQDTINSKKHVR